MIGLSPVGAEEYEAEVKTFGRVFGLRAVIDPVRGLRRRMRQIRRAALPFRFQIPQDLVLKLRGLRARQQGWDELIDAEDVVHLYYGLGAARYLAFDGRILVDPFDWDGTDAYEVTDAGEAFLAVATGAIIFDFPELRQLLPSRPAGVRDCHRCRGSGTVAEVDINGDGFLLACYKCAGLGWLQP